VWFKERTDRKLDPNFKDNTTRMESHIYNRTNPMKNEKFSDGCDKLIKPRVREADFGKKPKTIPRETKYDKPWCHTKSKYPRCVYELYEEPEKDRDSKKKTLERIPEVKQDPNSPDPAAKRSKLKPNKI
jgi:hypothetical protein